MRGAIHHIELYVSDLQLSKTFWGWLLGELGYLVYQEWSEGISFKLGETYIVLVQTEKEYLNIPYHRKGTGLNHLAFHVDTRAEVDEFYSSLKDRGISILYDDKHPFAGGADYYAVFFEDPDRMKVELVSSE